LFSGKFCGSAHALTHAKSDKIRLLYAGKSILIAVFKWVLPVWVLMFLVASGAIKLPFGIPFLDDLIR